MLFRTNVKVSCEASRFRKASFAAFNYTTIWPSRNEYGCWEGKRVGMFAGVISCLRGEVVIFKSKKKEERSAPTLEGNLDPSKVSTYNSTC
jgi:hypothetical protein